MMGLTHQKLLIVRKCHFEISVVFSCFLAFSRFFIRMHSDAQFAGSSSVPAHVEMMGLIGAGNNPMVGMTVAVAVAVEEASK